MTRSKFNQTFNTNIPEPSGPQQWKQMCTAIKEYCVRYKKSAYAIVINTARVERLLVFNPAEPLL